MNEATRRLQLPPSGVRAESRHALQLALQLVEAAVGAAAGRRAGLALVEFFRRLPRGLRLRLLAEPEEYVAEVVPHHRVNRPARHLTGALQFGPRLRELPPAEPYPAEAIDERGVLRLGGSGLAAVHSGDGDGRAD